MDARGSQVASGNKGQTADSKTALSELDARLAAVKEQLADNPGLLTLVNSTPGGDAVIGAEPTALTLPDGLSLDTGLLVYEGRALSERMDAARLEYADKSTNASRPRISATVVERPYPTQITPGLGP